jgi:hypothetical protein
MLPIVSFADDAPNKNDEGMKKVLGTITDSDQVQSSRKGGNGSVAIGNLPVDLGVLILDGILNTRTNYSGFPIYHVKVSDSITLNIGSHKSFKAGDCVLVWYDGAMGDSPDLSMPDQAGIEQSKDCIKGLSN